jgi:hypothetical protein
MAFLDYTFDSKGGGENHWQRYPHHSKVLAYLERFADDFGILPLIRFQETVVKVTALEGSRWTITTQTSVTTQKDVTTHKSVTTQKSVPTIKRVVGEFDAVMVCNGHYSKARVPVLPGISDFQGLLLHSHNYRNATPFEGKRVVVLGTAASGADISREISGVAETVYWCGESFSFPAGATSRGVHLFPKPLCFSGNDLEFPQDVVIKDVDIFLFCTGYEYEFPFLGTDIVRVFDNRVHPLYLDMVPPEWPSLAFIGLPFLVIPFPLFEMQARWFSKVLAGEAALPLSGEMNRIVSQREAEFAKSGLRNRHYHKLGDKQTDYVNKLALACGESKLPDWFGRLALEAQRSRLEDPENFRDKPMQFHGPTVISATSNGVTPRR